MLASMLHMHLQKCNFHGLVNHLITWSPLSPCACILAVQHPPRSRQIPKGIWEVFTVHDGEEHTGATAVVLCPKQSVLALFHMSSAVCIMKPTHFVSDPAFHLCFAVCAVTQALEPNSCCTISCGALPVQLTHMQAI